MNLWLKIMIMQMVCRVACCIQEMRQPMVPLNKLQKQGPYVGGLSKGTWTDAIGIGYSWGGAIGVGYY